MSRFLFAWELGGGMGHIVPLAQVAAPLVEAGHQVDFVLRDLSGATAALGPLAASHQVRLWQAPVWMPHLHGLPVPVSYAELLFRAGYLDAQRLAPLAAAWQRLFEAIAPDLLVADHAPTALLAAPTSLRRALIGTGFFLPPPVSPMPAFREWEAIQPGRLQAAEARALGCCNDVRAALGLPPLATLADLVRADEQFLLTWPELDHYGPGPKAQTTAQSQAVGRAGATYWGALAARSGGAPAQWPQGDGPALFAYLKSDHAGLEAVLQQLQQAPCRTLAYVPGLTPAQAQRYSSPRLRFSAQAVAMNEAMAQADAVLCNAGSGTVCTALQAGKPVLMLPMHAEQLLFARRVVAQGAGGMLGDAAVPTQLLPALARLFEPALKAKAHALAARNGPDRYGDVAGAVAARCIALASGH